MRQFSPDPLQGWGKARVIDQGATVGVIEEIDQLVFDVAIIDVERGEASLIGTDHSFEVLIAVVQIEADMGLARFEGLQRRALLPASQSLCMKEVGQLPRARGEGAPGQAPVAKHYAVAIGNRFSDRLVDGRKVEVHTWARSWEFDGDAS